MSSLSPNMLKTFDECPKKYYLKYVQNIMLPQLGGVFEKGKKIHALANYYLKGVDISELIKALSEEEFEIWKKLFSNEYFQKKSVNSEYNLSCKVDRYWIGGRLDALMRDKNKYYILDYKTGAIPKKPETDFQTIVYLLCVDKILKDYDELKFIYIDLKNGKNCEIDFDDKKKELYELKIKEICERMEKTTNFLTTDNCRFCEYKKICRKNYTTY